MMNFPDAPTVGQSFPPYTWDGTKWGVASLVMGDPPSATDPLMNGVVLPGLTYKYSRGDHRHPTDTSRAPVNNAALTGTTSGPGETISGVLTVSGTITAIATGGGHLMGAGTGDANASMTKALTNIILYDNGPDNWAGIGSDVNGRFFIRTGLSGTPAPAFWIDQTRVVQFLKTPRSPTPGAGDNSNKVAPTAFVLANPASGPYLLLSGGTVTGLMYINGDLTTQRVAPSSTAEGVIFLNNTGTRYLHYNADQYHLVSAHCYTANGRLWGNGDFGWPFINERLAYGWDQGKGINTGLSEDFGGACITGASGYDGAGTQISRYRQWQLQWGYGTWAAIGYA